MADINVERKGPSIWPWIIGLIVLALLIWALLEMFGNDDAVLEEPLVTDTLGMVEEVPPAPLPAPDGMATEDLPAAVEQFASTCAAPPDEAADLGMQHQFTVDCIQQLSSALDAVIARESISDTDVSQRLESLRQRAQALEASDPSSTDHANTAREAFTAAADLMAAVHQAGWAEVTDLGTEVSQAREAAQALDGAAPMLEQKEAVRSFFTEAADALRLMAEAPAATA